MGAKQRDPGVPKVVLAAQQHGTRPDHDVWEVQKRQQHQTRRAHAVEVGKQLPQRTGVGGHHDHRQQQPGHAH